MRGPLTPEFAGEGTPHTQHVARTTPRLLTRHWLGVHAAVLLAVTAFLALGWWQAIRAGEGNARSYGYAAEWPTFAVIVLFLWVRAMRTELRTPADQPRSTEAAPTPTTAPATERTLTAREVIAADEAEDPELAAYNRYLSGLHERHAKSGRG